MAEKFYIYPMDDNVIKNENIPIPASKVIPEWYKKIPQYTNNDKVLKIKFGTATNSTIKRCSPFLDSLSAGYVITTSEDINISWENNKPIIKWDSDYNRISEHSLGQKSLFPTLEGFYDQIFKWESSMAISLPDGYSLWCTHPSNRTDLPFFTLTGLVDCDSYNLPIKFPFFIRKEWTGVIKSGTPVVQLLPFKRDNWNILVGESDKNETEKRLFKYFYKIDRAYKNLHWKKKIWS